MVKICSNIYPEDSTYNTHFETFPYPLSPFQKHAIEAIVDENHVLVCAPTGSGKTLPGEFAIQHFVGLGKKLVYCSPIKALSNQKYYEFTNKYPHISFGLFTGDIKTNPEADVLIMTTEILMNYLFTGTKESLSAGTDTNPSLQFQIDIQRELACVIFDEVHYINDTDRGAVWEKTILMLPPHVVIIGLSATIDNPSGFAEWIENRYTTTVAGVEPKKVYLAYTNHRIVPLSHYGFVTTTESLMKAVKHDKALEKKIRDKTNRLIPLQDATGAFNELSYYDISLLHKTMTKYNVDSNRKHVLNQLSRFLRDQEMLPAIAFVFSRKQVESCAADITVPLLEDDSKVGYIVRRECEQIIRKLPNFNEYLELPEYNRLVSLLEKGVGIHHSGMIPILREIVELMISKRYIKLLFATESFAIGLDCPIKTAIFTSLTKFDGRGERFLQSHEYTQMAGRAGRRGIDIVGHVVHCNNLFTPPTMSDYRVILGKNPQKLVSKYHISYNLVLNLLRNCGDHGARLVDITAFSQKSMIYRELIGSITEQMRIIKDYEVRIENKNTTISMLHTPRHICELYLDLENRRNTLVNKRRREIDNEIQQIDLDYRTVQADCEFVKDVIELMASMEEEKKTLDYMQNFIMNQTQLVCNVLLVGEFIKELDKIDEEGEENGDENINPHYQLTNLGIIASNIAEIHPLILTELVVNSWNYFAEFSPKQIVGLFSCFTDIKIPDHERKSIPTTDDVFLKGCIESIRNAYISYGDIEYSADMRTGIQYEDALIYDMVDFAMQWCDYTTEIECKTFIQCRIAECGISVGDFTKAMLKIVTITREWMNVCEMLGQIEALHKLNQIEGMVLKYVTTSQSLYV